MEFQYRAGNERSRSPPTPTGTTAPASASSGSAAARALDGHGGDGAGYHGEISSAAAPSPTPPAPASDPDEQQRRREAKEMIRERILREEAEALQALELEAEVRHELMEKRFQASGLARPAAPGARAEGAEARASPALSMTADSPSPILLESMQPQPKANGSAALPAKRKNPDDVAAASAETSTVSAATSSKKQKPSGLTCTVCGITLTGEKPMQEHLKGKSHMRKAAMIAPSMPVAQHDENEKEDVIRSKENASAAALPAKRKNSDVVAAASTVPATAGSKKQKQDLTCTVCGVTSTSEKSLQDHLRGKSHQRKAAALALPPPPPEPAEHEEEGDYTPKKLTMRTNAGEMYDVMQMNGFLLCEVCDVKTADLVTMMCHLEGSKHTSKVRQKQLPGAGNPPPPVAAAAGSKKSVKGRRAAPPATTAAAVAGAGGHPEEVKKVDVPVVAAAVAATGGREAVLADQAKSNEASVVVASVTGHTTQGNDSMKVTERAAVEVEVAAPPATPQVDDVACAGASVSPMKVDEHAEVGDATAIAEEEKAAADAKSSATLQDGNETVKTHGVAVAPPGQEVKIQVEGKMCTTVVRQADGTLSCGLCGVHGCDKDGMLQHLYTTAHWGRVRLA